MKKFAFLFLVISIFGVFLSLHSTRALAEGTTPNYVSVQILSPDQVTAYPGFETTIQAEVTNNTNQTLNNLVVYITMVDLNKNMTVNLEDYNASIPVVITSLPANTSQTVELPIILVYPDVFHLYVTVANLDTMTIVSSDAIVTDIMSQASINPDVVTVTAIATPVLILFLALGVSLYRRRSIQNLAK